MYGCHVIWQLCNMSFSRNKNGADGMLSAAPIVCILRYFAAEIKREIVQEHRPGMRARLSIHGPHRSLAHSFRKGLLWIYKVDWIMTQHLATNVGRTVDAIADRLKHAEGIMVLIKPIGPEADYALAFLVINGHTRGVCLTHGRVGNYMR